MLATGGALASAFVAILAPLVFPGVWEYPILLVGALVALALVAPRVAAPSRTGRGLDFSPFVERVPRPDAAVPRVGGLIVVGLVATGALATEAGIRWLLVGGLVLLVGARRGSSRFDGLRRSCSPPSSSSRRPTSARAASSASPRSCARPSAT